MKIQDRFLKHVNKTDSCWLWTAAKFEKGYGAFSIDTKQYRAHRIAYELFKGPIPKGCVVMHSCDNPSCVNPEHLSIGTQADNIHDKFEKHRENISKGENHCYAKLTEKQVLCIRKEANLGTPHIANSGNISSIAKKYKISSKAVRNIINRKSWKHI